MPRPPRYSAPGTALAVFGILCAIAVLHSCLFYLDFDTPADPRTTSQRECVKWKKYETLRVPTMEPMKNVTLTCEEYSHATAQN